LASIATSYRIPSKEFEKQYKDHISDYHIWDQKKYAERYMLFDYNIEPHISIDEVSITNGELYTIITNKKGHGKKGTLIATIQGTKVTDIVDVLRRIPLVERQRITEVTLDMADNMARSVKAMFPNANLVLDRFHVQQLVTEAVQRIRINIRHKILDQENKRAIQARKQGKRYYPFVYTNGDTLKQLLARSRYLLFKPSSRWHESQRERADILFKLYPEIKEAYNLSMMFRSVYEHSKTKKQARSRLMQWYAVVNQKNIDGFIAVADTIQLHENDILNYFINRSTNASAESFNAKIKGFRTLLRGVRDKSFFFFRLATLYA
jgi:transposase